MSKKTAILSSAGLKNIIVNQDDHLEEFSFVFKDQEIKLQRIFAEFISPLVSHLHQSDPTIDEIKYDEILQYGNDEYLSKRISDIFSDSVSVSQIKSVSRGQPLDIAAIEESEMKQHLDNLGFLSILIGNEELYELIESNRSDKMEKTTREKIDELIVYADLFALLPAIDLDKIISDFSSKISGEDANDLKRVPKRVFYSMMTSPSFHYEDADSLVDIISSIFSEERETRLVIESESESELSINSFYENVCLSKLSSLKFKTVLSSIDYSSMTCDLWRHLCEILEHKKEDDECEEKHETQENEFSFDGNSSHRFNGIIHHLCLNHERNICEEGIIQVTSSKYCDNYPPKNAVDFNSNKYFKSDSSDGKAWLKYDFKDKKIRPTHYSIRTRDDSDNQNPQSWVIEVSNTDRDDDWRIIDTRTNVSSVSKRNSSDTFEISTHLGANEIYRFIRFRHTDYTTGCCGCLAISSLEYFGNLIKS